MQQVSVEQLSHGMQAIEHADEEITHYILDELLPAGQVLALNSPLGTLSLILPDPQTPYPRMKAEQQFTMSELSLLLPLLNSHPHYCPYEVMLASFDHRLVTEATVDRCRNKLHEAQLEGVWDHVMRPVRNVLSRTRIKMHVFDLEISSILETGYCLMVLPERRRAPAAPYTRL
jgi:hypothetical protein